MRAPLSRARELNRVRARLERDGVSSAADVPARCDHVRPQGLSLPTRCFGSGSRRCGFDTSLRSARPTWSSFCSCGSGCVPVARTMPMFPTSCPLRREGRRLRRSQGAAGEGGGGGASGRFDLPNDAASPKSDPLGTPADAPEGVADARRTRHSVGCPWRACRPHSVFALGCLFRPESFSRNCWWMVCWLRAYTVGCAGLMRVTGSRLLFAVHSCRLPSRP